MSVFVKGGRGELDVFGDIGDTIVEALENAGIDLLKNDAGPDAEVAAVFDLGVLRSDYDGLDFVFEAGESLRFQSVNAANDENAVLDGPQGSFGPAVPVRVPVKVVRQVAVRQLFGHVQPVGVRDVGVGHHLVFRQAVERLACGGEFLEPVVVEIFAFHDACLGIEIHLFVADGLQAFHRFAVNVELYAVLVFPESGFGQ